MQEWKLIDKERLVVFTDALMAIIMTILVLDLKVQVTERATEADLLQQLKMQLPHFFGFILSFAVITIIWFSHHDLTRLVIKPTRFFAGLNFLFVGSVSLLPFSTAFAAENPDSSVAVATLAGSMFFMNIFLSFLFFYSMKKGLINMQGGMTRHNRIKQIMGISGGFIFLGAVGVAFLSPFVSLLMMSSVPIMHVIPIVNE